MAIRKFCDRCRCEEERDENGFPVENHITSLLLYSPDCVADLCPACYVEYKGIMETSTHRLKIQLRKWLANEVASDIELEIKK